MDDAEHEDLLRRLQARFPDRRPELIAAVVGAAADRLAGRPIQDFTPVLVERAAVEELRTVQGG